MKYLHYYDTKTAHDAVYNGNEYEEPWTAYIENDKSVIYNKPHDYSKDYFTITALGDGNFQFFRKGTGNFDYSLDKGETWISTDTSNTIQINLGQELLLRSTDSLGSIITDFDFDVSGNVMSLIYADEFKDATELRYGTKFESLLALSRVVNANNLILPATTLTEFSYSHMFKECTSLVTAPELPATTLAKSCYIGMFQGCTSLTTAPELPAMTLTNSCYNYMFSDCTSLNYIKAMFTTAPSTSYTRDWVNGVASTGTFVKNSAATWNVTGANGVPNGWTVQTASA